MVTGVIHIANKRNRTAFTAPEEMVLTVFVHHLEWLLGACNEHTRARAQTHILQILLKSSVDLDAAVAPPVPDAPAGRGARTVAEILAAVEEGTWGDGGCYGAVLWQQT